MLDTLPTVEEMIAALNSPVVPETGARSDDIELSTEDMIKMMFNQIMQPPASS
jgi:prolyl-tRNA editing enzyme YbaK/EbsC (Cys-tRNA(Pro) deacylase)